MTRLFATIGVGVIAVGGAVYALLSPSFLEWRVERACPQIADPSCAARVRALGHVFAFKGNTEKAVHWYRQAAESGDAMSMFHLAWMIEQKALNTFQSDAFTAAAAGNTPDSRKAQAEFETAASWYRKSATKGYAPAMNNLGQVYARGLAAGRNPQMAAHYYRLAAQAGNPIAGFNLSLAHLLGDGVAQSGTEAEKWMVWSPERKYDKGDLQQPTLERTRINGGMLAEELRTRLRAAADSGPPATVKLEFRPLKPVASLPTFEDIRRQSGGPTR